MVYRKRPQKSRRYRKSHTPEHNQSVEYTHAEHSAHMEVNSQPEGEVPSPVRETEVQERKKSQPFGFLTSLFGGDKVERSGSPLFTIFDFDIFLDDLILAGLIILLLTDKVQDEILLIVLLYLLLDIF